MQLAVRCVGVGPHAEQTLRGAAHTLASVDACACVQRDLHPRQTGEGTDGAAKRHRARRTALAG